MFDIAKLELYRIMFEQRMWNIIFFSLGFGDVCFKIAKLELYNNDVCGIVINDLFCHANQTQTVGSATKGHPPIVSKI